ncbi:MAG: transposon-transfer assisting family protein [Gracilibacteraceae bacterium]|jgi:hypothetical protein|nr:transposon-transfer assisting family protein [Gracilibacteraceae bacterium]
MNEIFTVPEVNLMGIFDVSSRENLIAELTGAAAEFEDEEMLEIAALALDKLSGMSDAEFAALDLCPEYEDYGEETEV